jgi:hypothetical protein
MDLHQGGHAQVGGFSMQCSQFPGGQDCGDQQHRIGSGPITDIDVILINDKVLAKQRCLGIGPFDIHQIIKRTGKSGPVRSIPK